MPGGVVGRVTGFRVAALGPRAVYINPAPVHKPHGPAEGDIYAVCAGRNRPVGMGRTAPVAGIVDLARFVYNGRYIKNKSKITIIDLFRIEFIALFLDII